MAAVWRYSWGRSGRRFRRADHRSPRQPWRWAGKTLRLARLWTTWVRRRIAAASRKAPVSSIAMPLRATKRGADRTALRRDCDVLICGASFAGLAVARELAGSGADVLVIDRYEIGERQTSACGIPTSWLQAAK